MKTPKLIYTYFANKHDAANCMIHEIRIYTPRLYNRAKTVVKLGDHLFTVSGQSNLDRDHHVGFKRAYALRFEDLPVERPESIKLAAKLSAAACTRDEGFPMIVKTLRKLGAARFALGKVSDPRSYNGKEFMPRRFAGKRSEAYWTAINAGLEIE